ncbi:ferredoxin [Streptomyces sp. NPDC093097]|uniref:ferredoxin n=1 Tax=Streptomyces sp. NPDC093097 TaxID=3366027 RepID=UPI00381DBF91
MINSDLCQGSGQCFMSAPELFDLGDDGLAAVLRAAESPKEAENAVGLCPMQAIAVRAEGADG